MRNVLWTIGLLGTLVVSTAATAAAQTGSQTNPYNQPSVNPWCAFNPYNLNAVSCMDTRQAGSGVSVTPTVYKFGEGVVHAPGSELAWVILTNFDTVPQTAVVELLVSGRPQPVMRSVTLAPKERRDLSLHEFTEFGGGGIVTFSTGVYFPLSTGHASLVMRPMTDVWSKVTLPPATVTQGSASAGGSEQ